MESNLTSGPLAGNANLLSVKVFLDNGEISPQAEFWSGVFLLIALVVNDAVAIITAPPDWYLWPVGLAWLGFSIWLIRHGRQRMRAEK